LFLNGDDYTANDLLVPVTASNYKTILADKSLISLQHGKLLILTRNFGLSTQTTIWIGFPELNFIGTDRLP